MADNMRTDGLLAGDRHYQGQGLGAVGVWKCPACRAENTGPLSDGCASCGSGSAKPSHVGHPPPIAPQVERALDAISASARMAPTQFELVQADLQHGLAVQEAAMAWAAAHEQETLVAAFLAGYKLATDLSRARTMQAPPVTADIQELAPEGKTKRTILAALLYFREHVLPQATDEVASGEWCSLEEIDTLIAQLQEGSHD